MNKYIDLLSDFGFKRLFGTEANKDLLIDFLSQFFPEDSQVEDLTYLKTEHIK
jgi:PD-(D/E)XK nuclease family transposase